MQASELQSAFKSSYYLEENAAERLDQIHQALDENDQLAVPGFLGVAEEPGCPVSDHSEPISFVNRVVRRAGRDRDFALRLGHIIAGLASPATVLRPLVLAQVLVG